MEGRVQRVHTADGKGDQLRPVFDLICTPTYPPNTANFPTSSPGRQMPASPLAIPMVLFLGILLSLRHPATWLGNKYSYLHSALRLRFMPIAIDLRVTCYVNLFLCSTIPNLPSYLCQIADRVSLSLSMAQIYPSCI